MKRPFPFALLGRIALIVLVVFVLATVILTLLGPVVGSSLPDPMGPPTEDIYDFERILVSPDARMIAFNYYFYIADTQQSRTTFYLVNRDGSDLRLIPTDAYVREVAWSPDNRQMACVGIQDDNWNILIVNTDDGSVRQLVSDTDLKHELTWFSDGETLAYERRKDSGMQPYLVSIDISTGKTQQLTTVQGQWVLSPDNKRIALIDTIEDQVDLFVVDADGTDRQQLTDTSAIEALVQWSLDGDKLAYLSQTKESGSKLWLHEVYALRMSDHSAQLVTGDYRGHLSEPGAFTHLKIDPTEPNPSRFAWSPDGNHFAFETEGKVYVADADGANPNELISPNFRPAMVGWLEDSSAVLVYSYDGDYLAVDMDDGSIRPLSNDEIASYFPYDSLDIQRVCKKDSPHGFEWAMYHPCLRMELHIVDGLTNELLFRITPEQLIQPESTTTPK